jgi:hypothetical protein
MRIPPPRKRDAQAGRAIDRSINGRGQILFPDAGAKPLNVRIHRFQDRRRDGYGSHHDGRHKMG